MSHHTQFQTEVIRINFLCTESSFIITIFYQKLSLIFCHQCLIKQILRESFQTIPIHTGSHHTEAAYSCLWLSSQFPGESIMIIVVESHYVRCPMTTQEKNLQILCCSCTGTTGSFKNSKTVIRKSIKSVS